MTSVKIEHKLHCVHKHSLTPRKTRGVTDSMSIDRSCHGGGKRGRIQKKKIYNKYKYDYINKAYQGMSIKNRLELINNKQSRSEHWPYNKEVLKGITSSL